VVVRNQDKEKVINEMMEKDGGEKEVA